MNRNGNSRSNQPGVKSYVSKAGWYALSYPPTWVAEENDDCVTFFDPEGVGALQISAYETPQYEDCKKILLEYLGDSEISVAESDVEVAAQRGRCVATCRYIQPPWFRQVWYVTQVSRLVMITYNCKVESRGQEDEEVNQIVQSLSICG